MKNLKSLLPALGLFLLLSCKKDKEAPIACIDGPEKVARKESVQYTWCGSWVTQSEVQWTTSWGQTGSGSWFSPEFPGIGKYTITATGSNKNGTATKTKDVEYGLTASAKVVLTNECFVGNTAISSASGYTAYVYASLADWTSDLKSQSHSKAIDSSGFKFSSQYQTIFSEITTTTTPGNKLYFSVENKSSGTTSNFGNLALNARNPNSGTDAGQLLMTDWDDNVVYSKVDAGSKQFLNGKWKLTSTVMNGNSTLPDICNQDDYLVFFPDGTWQYNIGTDNCAGASSPSNGTYTFNFPICGEVYFGLNTSSGPFTGSGFVINYNEVRVNFNIGSNIGYFVFKYAAN